jgi:hypothetical protein
MSKWRSLSSQVGADKFNSWTAQLTLSAAYKEVFQGKPSREQQEIVLADLMAKSGWNQVSSGVSSEELWRREGMRSLFGVVFSHISLAPDDLFDLENAARKETALSLERRNEGSLR